MLISKFRPKGARYGNAALKGCVQFVQRMQDFPNKSRCLLGSDQIVDNLEIAGKLTPHIFVEDAAQRTTADLSTELRFARDDSCVWGLMATNYSGAKARLLRAYCGTRPTLNVAAPAVPWRFLPYETAFSTRYATHPQCGCPGRALAQSGCTSLGGYGFVAFPHLQNREIRDTSGTHGVLAQESKADSWGHLV